jgi:hypothetical protein
MPTSRPRHTLTETNELERALDDAARRWPEDRDARSKLLLRLVRRGHSALRAEQTRDVERRREAVQRTRGSLTGAFPKGYLTRLRDDWPT